MISLGALNLGGRQSVKSSIKWCMAPRQDARCVTTVLLLLQPVNPKGLGLINRMIVAYPQRMLVLSLDAARVFHAGKRVRGSDLPLWLLTNWYYHYDLTPRVAKPGPAYTWHSEPEHITWNHNSEPRKSVREQRLQQIFDGVSAEIHEQLRNVGQGTGNTEADKAQRIETEQGYHWHFLWLFPLCSKRLGLSPHWCS